MVTVNARFMLFTSLMVIGYWLFVICYWLLVSGFKRDFNWIEIVFNRELHAVAISNFCVGVLVKYANHSTKESGQTAFLPNGL